MKKALAVVLIASLLLAAGFTFLKSREVPAGRMAHGQLLRLFVIDCGQGDAIYASLPSGESILVDGGSGEEAHKVLAFLKDRGVTAIDLVVATHAHEDHIGGLDSVLAGFDVGRLCLPQIPGTSKAYYSMVEAADERDITMLVPDEGEYLIGDAESDLSVRCIAPCGTEYDDMNESSTVLRVSFLDRSVLLCADAGAQSAADMLLYGCDIGADVVKLAHHGSASPLDREFLSRAAPEYAVVSCARENGYGHPHAETLALCAELGITVFRTDLHGTVSITTDGKSLSVTAERTERDLFTRIRQAHRGDAAA